VLGLAARPRVVALVTQDSPDAIIMIHLELAALERFSVAHYGAEISESCGLRALGKVSVIDHSSHYAQALALVKSLLLVR
jgi:hypothetical protein